MDATKKTSYDLAQSFVQIYILTFIFYCFAMCTSFLLNYLENQLNLFDYKKLSSFVLVLLVVLRVTISIFFFYYLLHFLQNHFTKYFKEERIQKSSLIFFLTCAAYDTNMALKVNELKRRFDRILEKAKYINISINTSSSKGSSSDN